ncbi:MAG: hypothetical protein IJ464_07605 [Alistipes sp.]|nr:hypothetical protein [Alistipes sp.]
MKKLFVLMAACALFAACGGPGDKAVDYMEEMKEAIENKDYKKVEKLSKEIEEWEKTLSDEEKKEAEKAVEKWVKENGGDWM